MKWLKIILISLVVILALLALGFYLLQDKAKNGWARYETEKPTLTITEDRPAVLHFTKTTGWRHSSAIEASKQAIVELCKEQDWQLYQTEEGGVFNAEQLGLFDVVIWDNSTGPVLNEEQQTIFENYINSGGGYVGIHGAGDFSHHEWSWYTSKIRSRRPQFFFQNQQIALGRLRQFGFIVTNGISFMRHLLTMVQRSYIQSMAPKSILMAT